MVQPTNGLPPKPNVFTSKRLWVTVSSVIFVLLEDGAGITGMDPQTIQLVVLGLVGLVIGDSVRGVGVKSQPVQDARLDMLLLEMRELRLAMGAKTEVAA